MKFDPTQWDEIEIGVSYETEKGLLHVMCTEQAQVFVEAQGIEALAGIGYEVRKETKGAVRFQVNAKKGARAFVFTPASMSFEPTGATFTNIDRKPMESGSVLEVTKALRQMRLEAMALRKGLAAAANPKKPEPEPEPQPEPEPEPPVEADTAEPSE